MQHALLQALVRGVAKVVFRRHAHAIDQGRRKVRQLRLAQHEGEVAALGNFFGVGNGRGQIGKQGLHLLGGLEILLAREAPHPLGVAEQVAVRNTDARFVGFKVVGRGKLHRVRGHHRQAHACGQLGCGHHMGFVVGAPCALQLQIKAVGKDAGQLQRHIVRALGIALHQGLAHRPGLCAREANQPFIELFQPRQLGRYLGLAGVLRMGAGQQLGQIEIALLVLHQQHHARGGQGVGAHAFHNHLCAYQRLDALGAAGPVELDRGKEVVEVSNRQRALAIGCGRVHHLVHTVGAVDDRKFGM